MKPERALVAERMLAQHCPELLRSSNEPAPVQLIPALTRLSDGVARVLSNALASLSASEPPAVRSLPPRECTMAELAQTVAPLAANSLLSAGSDLPALASIDAAAVLRMVDRAFGGRGDAPSPLPTAFPLSAELMVMRLEGVVVSALGQAMMRSFQPVRRDGCILQLEPFEADEMLGVITLEIDDPGRSSWKVTLAVPRTALIKLFGEGEKDATKPAARTFEANPANDPVGSVPLTLSAVLVDMNIGFAALSNLQPGMILPVAVARSVPIKVGDKTVALGTIGALDDRVAVQITQAF